MRKIALLIAVASAVGCGGSGNSRFDVDPPLPMAGTYSGDGSILASGQPTTAPVQSAEVDAQGQTHIVVGPFTGAGGATYTVSGTFLRNQRFNGTINTNSSENGVPVTGTYISSNSEFKLSIPNFPNGNQEFSVLAQLTNPL